MKKKFTKKSKILLIVGVVLIVLSSSYVAMASFNYLPFPGLNSMIRYPDSQSIAKISVNSLFLEFEINSSIINEIGELDMNIELEIFGIKNSDIESVFDWYKSEFSTQGWGLYKELHKTGSEWELYCGVWTKGLMVQSAVVVEGTIFDKYTSYDIISGAALTNAISLTV
jgi:hypothetical protein